MKYAIREFMCPKRTPIESISNCSECHFVKAYNKFCDKDDLPYCGRPLLEHKIHEIIKELKGIRITKNYVEYIIYNDNDGYKKRVILWHLVKGYKFIGESGILQEEMDI